jgi:hypothetical protein
VSSFDFWVAVAFYAFCAWILRIWWVQVSR